MTGRHTPFDIQQVRGFPTALQIYRIPASRFWQVRLRADGKYHRKSTKCENQKEAVEFARRYFDDSRIAERLGTSFNSESFYSCAKKLLDYQRGLISRGDRDPRINIEDEKKLKKDILPYFGKMSVSKIQASDIDDYVNYLVAERDLSSSTLNKHVVVIRKVLREALKYRHITSYPIFPSIKHVDHPRPYFDDEEYRKLTQTARSLAKKDIKVRYVPLTEEICDFIIFHTNVFVRPSDIKVLKHSDVKIVEGKDRYLSIYPPHSKTIVRASFSMPNAIPIYKRLKKRQEERGMGGADDYVFFPEKTNRDYAWQTIQRQFNRILEEADLKVAHGGRKRTVYSLRHTAIMFRLMNSKNPDVFLLAKNSLTSIGQLERFYLSHVEVSMRIEEFQSIKNR